MAGVHLYTSNRLEILAEALAEALSTPLKSPFDREIIVVQSQGMARWVSLEMAKHHGVCANYDFPFPNRFVRQVFRWVMPGTTEDSAFDPKIMTWRIMSCLPRLMERPGFEVIRDYVRGSERDLRLLQLSERIADLFDQYLLFRTEMIFRWERGEGDNWQAILWRELARNSNGSHRAALARAFFEAIRRHPGRVEGLPERVSVFGISSLPRFHVNVLSAISAFTEVNLFLMNPCKEYWGDILTDWEMKGITRQRVLTPPQKQEFHLEKGNSLLASMGVLGRDFVNMFNELDMEENHAFVDPGETNLLCSIQSDILNLRDYKRDQEGKRTISRDDESIGIHSCHSPMREVEVLYDQILRMFERDPSLEPKDILVMTPDIESYAPFIQAVFDVPEQESLRIPYSIADRSIRNESEVIEPFLKILDLAGSRVGVSQVLAILESRSVLRKFGLKEEDLETIRRWIAETRIRWGIDEKTREQEGLPPFRSHSWREGIERLLLGYAMPGGNERLFSGILPYDNIEGSETQVLGGLVEFVERLFSLIHSLKERRDLTAWAGILSEILDELFMPDEERGREVQVLRDVISDLQRVAEQGPPVFGGKIDIKALKWAIGSSLERRGLGFGFMSGGVTFCAMLPMRSIPFRVICLLGMDGDAYPRESNPLSFDLMAQHPRPGDRSRRLDDRYLFLEALLSARERFYISFVGQNIKDNSVMPPSVLVSELMDYIEQGFEVDGGYIMDRIFTRHRLQAFNPEYFEEGGGDKHFSYSETNCRAARSLVSERMDPTPFIERRLEDPGEDWKTIDIEDLSRFFGNPSKFLLNRRLGLYLQEERPILEERESFELKGLDRYLLGEEMVRRKIEGKDMEDFSRVVKAAGRIPPGTVGECAYENLEHSVEHFLRKMGSYLQEEGPEPVHVDLEISGIRLAGRTDFMPSGWHLLYRFGKIRAKDRLKAWINHLVLQACKPEGYSKGCLIGGWDQAKDSWLAWQYEPVADSRSILAKLLEIFYGEGMVRPIHFFPESSLEYAKKALSGKRAGEVALQRARALWEGDEHREGEGARDPYFTLCFRRTDPLDGEFQRLALEIYGPMLEHERQVK